MLYPEGGIRMFLVRAMLRMLYNSIMTLISLALILWSLVEFAF